MARFKSQTELADAFVQGEKGGSASFLTIIGDTVYSTEVPESPYHPIAIRLTENVMLVNIRKSGTQFNDYSKKIQAAMEKAPCPIYQIIEVLIKSKTNPAEPPVIIDISDRLRDAKANHERTLKHGTEADIHQSTELIAALAPLVHEESKKEDLGTFEALASLPETLEKAIKAKYIDSLDLEIIIEQKKQAEALLTKGDNYLAVLMQMPINQVQETQEVQPSAAESKTCTELLLTKATESGVLEAHRATSLST
jgi:hypothetical protein